MSCLFHVTDLGWIIQLRRRLKTKQSVPRGEEVFSNVFQCIYGPIWYHFIQMYVLDTSLQSYLCEYGINWLTPRSKCSHPAWGHGLIHVLGSNECRCTSTLEFQMLFVLVKLKKNVLIYCLQRMEWGHLVVDVDVAVHCGCRSDTNLHT